MPNNVTKPIQWMQSGNPATVDDAVLRYPGQLGGEVTVKQPGPAGPPGSPTDAAHREKTFKYVQTDSSMAVSPFLGAVAWWAHVSNYLVTTNPATLGRGRVAGVFQGVVTPGNYGYVQIKGPGIVKFVDAPTAAPTAAGLIVIPSATAGKADCLAAGSAATYPALGKSASALDGGTAQAVVELDVPHGRP